jgi:hypothetical protein
MYSFCHGDEYDRDVVRVALTLPHDLAKPEKKNLSSLRVGEVGGLWNTAFQNIWSGSFRQIPF